ncbi:hypothetical protein CFC21_104996 [Triticum aestivum]|uniref:Zinc finger GRF-type domain-containing protein n=2 Tax=Triticum aestivum TaxID=4565 RepID=A0A3B6SSS8_WHEAT|nr:hypothetical protein CFC21_104996 [Triticum aestivum]
MRPVKCVAFEGILTGRRFYGCPVQENGVNCGVVEWVDGPWPPVLQRCLSKLWEMFHEQNCGRVLDNEKFEKELSKLRTENDKLHIEDTKLVEDLSKMFYWQDGRVDKKVYQKQMEEEDFEKKKEVEEKVRLEVQMEKLKLAKE